MLGKKNRLILRLPWALVYAKLHMQNTTLGDDDRKEGVTARSYGTARRAASGHIWPFVAPFSVMGISRMWLSTPPVPKSTLFVSMVVRYVATRCSIGD